MRDLIARVFRYVVLVVVGFSALTFVAVMLGWVSWPWKSAAAAENVEPSAAACTELGVELVADPPHTLRLPEDVRRSLGILKGQKDLVAVAHPPTRTQSLVLPGSTALDPNRLYRIRARFAPARVIEIAPVRDEAASLEAGKTVMRELHQGDRVEKGDLLGVFYSVDVGNKKNDLIDALLQLRLDQKIFDLAQEGYLKGAVPEVFLLNAERNLDGDKNAVKKAVLNLRTWDIPEEDIQAIYKEAEEIGNRKDKRRTKEDKEKDWPRVELRAPNDGWIVERNVAQGEMVVDNTVNLFQIAKVERLLVRADAPEDEVPTLQALPINLRKWTVRTVGAAAVTGLTGPIDEIGYLIDPNQHTAVIKGYIDNPGGRILGGQFVSATVQIPPPPGVVEVPIDAVAEDGQTCLVFVQTDPETHHYTMRRVQLTHRFAATAFVRSTPIPEKEQRTAAEADLGMPPKEPLRPGERVLTTAVGELKAALLSLEAQPNKGRKGGRPY